MVSAVTRKGDFMEDRTALRAALRELVEAQNERINALERATLDRMSILEGPDGHTSAAKLDASFNQLFTVVNSLNRQLDAQTNALIELAKLTTGDSGGNI